MVSPPPILAKQPSVTDTVSFVNIPINISFYKHEHYASLYIYVWLIRQIKCIS